MNTSHVAALLAQAGLPSLTDEQLARLEAAGARKGFDSALLDFACGDRAAVKELELVVRSLSPTLPHTFEDLGLQFDLAQVLTTARDQGRQLFAALHAYRTKPEQREVAARYLRSLEFLSKSASTAAKPQVAAAPYYSFKIFGSSAALCIAEASTRAGNQHTVNIEGAVLAGDGDRKVFDWPNKIVVQLTVQEAYQVLALLENKIRSLRFDGHGRVHDKSLQIEFQDSHYFVRLIQRGRAAVAVPVRPVDAIPLVSLLYKQLLRNEPHLRIEDICAMVDRMAAMTSR